MDFHDYLNRQKAEDRRAFIIHYPPRSGKTKFAKRILDSRDDVFLLDVQNHLSNYSEIMKNSQFGFRFLRDLLMDLSVEEAVVIIDNVDILLNTWQKKDFKDFINWLKVQLRSPARTKKTFIFIVQTEAALNGGDLTNSYGDPRVLALDAFEAI